MSSSRYEVVQQGLRDYMSQSVKHIGRERNELEALPGYREGFARAKSSEEVRARLAPLFPQIATIQAKYAADWEESTAASERLASIFAELDDSDIRQLLNKTATDEQTPFAFQILCRFLARSRNVEAVFPLIERLQSPVPMRPQYKCKNSWYCFVDAIAKRTLLRSMERETDELYRVLERRTTLRLLGGLQDRRAEAAIRPFLNDTDAGVREAAQEALSRLSEV